MAYGVRRQGQRRWLAFVRSPGESPAAWEGLRGDLYRRGLEGNHRHLLVTDGGPGLAAALQTVYPRVLHQRCQRKVGMSAFLPSRNVLFQG